MKEKLTFRISIPSQENYEDQEYLFEKQLKLTVSKYKYIFETSEILKISTTWVDHKTFDVLRDYTLMAEKQSRNYNRKKYIPIQRKYRVKPFKNNY